MRVRAINHPGPNKLFGSLDNDAMNWDDYDVFCHVIEHGGFSAAARAMDRPKSTVSASIGRLETELGTRLLERTTRQVRLTEPGETLYQSIGVLFTGLREARTDALAQGEVVAGTLRIATPYEFGAHHIGPVACSLMARYPQLKVRIDVEHHAVNPLEHRYDIAFAMLDAGLPASSVVQRRMFTLERGVFASPELLQRLGEPVLPQDLSSLPLLCGSADTKWTFTAADGTSEAVPTPTSRLNSGNADVRLQAAIAGLGVARITATFCEQAVRAGKLRRLLTNYTCAPLRVYALLPGKRLMPAKVRMFLDALGEQAGIEI
ncbi:D-malate degradation protein R [Variovorax sp. PBL-E5]|nr:D-malate degradation protein R [Variovorax sp. PBL-E5]